MVKSGKFRGDDDLKRLQNKIRDLENQRELDERGFKQIENDLKRRIKTLEDLSREKDKKLGKLQNSLKQIKADILGEKEVEEKTYENVHHILFSSKAKLTATM